MNSIFKPGLFEGKTAVITGGGTGIGLRIARELAYLGASVVLASRKMANLKKAVDLITAEGGKAFAVECNIRVEESVKDCVAKSMELLGRVDFLVNNGGGQFPSPAEMINRKGWNAVIETNLTGTFFMSQEMFNRQFVNTGGAIVNIIANMSRGFPILAHTGAARAGVENLTKSLATEWGRYGVRINSVSPGTIKSSGLETYDDTYRDFIYSFGKNNQAYRLGTEAEVSSAVLFLLSPGASYISGVTLSVDAGESLYSPIMPPVENDRNPPYEG
ncbi:MAG TPA: SDR family oxidoreductase [Chitinophagales bacterium]|nr:SDR family oxidoreductase [Chitinophagales bacterium]